jgi:hypothetical protein
MSNLNRVAVLCASLTVAVAAHAQVVRFDVLQSSPAFEGRSFGAVGPYVKITARATIAVDPNDPRNAIIADLDKAPRNAQGRVEATADVVLLRPADPLRGNGTLFVDILNRGRKLAPQLFDEIGQPAASAADKAGDAGIGFLPAQGYTMAWIGWQADIPSQANQMALQAPSVIGLTGTSREEFVFDHPRSPAPTTLEWPIADPASLQVTVRQKWDDPRQKPAGLSIHATGAQSVEITRPASGFDDGALYEVTYLARDPVVLGLGFAATRDVAAFLRHDATAANPLVAGGHSSVQRAIAFGVSQSGRFLRDFLYLGFNEDLAGGIVFDGLMPHVAGGRRMATNDRFGQPGRNPRHPEDPAWQADLFPFTYKTLYDPVSGRRDGLLQRCSTTATCPRVIQTDSEIEWWSSHASLVVTDTAGNHVDLPPNVRMYMIAGTPHFSEPGERMHTMTAVALPANPMHSGMPMRALLTDMQAWIANGIEPPTSRVPMRAHGTLVEAADAVPRGIPGLPYSGVHTHASLSDMAPATPVARAQYPVFVPRADRDGNSIDGVHMPAIAVPRGTYTGWNPRATGYGPAALYPLIGAAVPFPATRAEREAAGDPRLSIAERYANDAAYVEAVRAASAELVVERLLLPEDAKRAVDLATQGKLSQLQ